MHFLIERFRQEKWIFRTTFNLGLNHLQEREELNRFYSAVVKVQFRDDGSRKEEDEVRESGAEISISGSSEFRWHAIFPLSVSISGWPVLCSLNFDSCQGYFCTIIHRDFTSGLSFYDSRINHTELPIPEKTATDVFPVLFLGNWPGYQMKLE